MSISREQFAKLVQVEERIQKIEASYAEEYKSKLEALTTRLNRVESQLKMPGTGTFSPPVITSPVRLGEQPVMIRQAQSDMHNMKEHILPSARHSSKPQANSTLSMKRSSMHASGATTRVLSPVNVPKHI